MVIKYDYKVIFDPIYVGTQTTKSFTVENGQNYKTWDFLQYSEFEPCINAFSLKKKVSKYAEREKHEIIITYQPLLPEQTNINYYKIINIDEKEYILYIKGYSLGLSVYTSIKYVRFYRSPTDNKVKTKFEIHNKSKCKINFQFDIDNNQKVFELHPKKGSVDPERYIYVTAQFVIEKIGVYFLDVPCLINFHFPLYIELLGINHLSPIDAEIKDFHAQPTEISLEDNFEKFFSENIGLYNSQPIFRLISKYLRFSLSNDETYCLPEVINLTNKCLLTIWDFQSDSNVNVNPNQFYIRPEERTCFQVKFEPKTYENLYGGCLYGRGFIFGENKKQTDPGTIIIPLSLRYIGNSFIKTEIWVPEIKIIPDVVLMPPCLSKFSVYSVFRIKNIGQYPAVFEIRPPDKTRFSVKPMLGMIANGFQIILVKFTGGTAEYETIEENWKIIFNQNEKIFSKITFTAFVKSPMITVNGNNKIIFGPQFPGFKKYVSVIIENISQHKIKYMFITNKWYAIDKPEGILDSFEYTEITFCLTCDCDLPEICFMNYELRVLLQNQIISKIPYVKIVELISKCAFGTLCSSPSTHNFETVVCGEEQKVTFNIFNFSELRLHFSLKIHMHYGVTDENAVNVTPLKGSIPSGGHLPVTVTVCTSYRSLTTYCINYYLCESEGSDKLIDNRGRLLKTSGTIFQMHYFSFYPTIKFVEIGRSSAGCIFTKLNVWEYFQMDGFNRLLHTIQMNETEKYKFRVPDAEANLGIQKTICFIVKNISRKEIDISFERKKICDCELKEVKSVSGVGSFRKYTYEPCPHRKLVNMYCSDKIIPPYATSIVTIDIFYPIYGTHEVCFLLKMSHNRCIEIYIEVVGLQSTQLSTFVQGFTFIMNDVYLGSLEPELQFYWFCNNTRTDSFYKLDTEVLDEYNKKWGFPVLLCINPKDLVEAKSTHYIEFLFCPIAAGEVKVELPFRFGPKDTTLTVIGHAKPYFVSPLEHVYFTELGKEYRKLNDLLIRISTEHIVFRSLPTHCSIKRILTIQNVSEKHTVGFTFDNVYIEGIISGSIYPSAGFLNPNERIPLILTVKSGGTTCTVRICIECHLVNHSVFEEHLTTTSEFYQQSEQRYDMFCIGESGERTYPEVPTVVITPAPKVFHRVISITCHIIPQVDIDVKITIQDQLKQTPFTSLLIYDSKRLNKFLINRKHTTFLKGRQSSKTFAPISARPSTWTNSSKTNFIPDSSCPHDCCVAFSEEEFIGIHTVLSCLLHENIFKKSFKYHIGLFDKVPVKHYTEYKINLLTPEDENTQLELILRKIPRRYLAETMQIILSDAVLKYFRLGTYPFSSIDCSNITTKKKMSSAFGTNVYSEKFTFLFDKQ